MISYNQEPSKEMIEKVRDLLSNGFNRTEVADILGISRMSVQRVCKFLRIRYAKKELGGNDDM